MIRRRPRAVAVTLVLTGAMALASCTGGDVVPGPDRLAPAPEPSAVRGAPSTDTTSPAAALTVVAEPTDVEASLRTSRELFASSPVVVVAPSGQPAVQTVAAHAAVGLGVPLLLTSSAAAAPVDGAEASATPGDTAPTGPPSPGTPDPGLAAELDRLGTVTVLAVGDVGGLGDEAGGPAVVRAEATPAGLARVTGLLRGATVSSDPATSAGEVAALTSGGPAPATPLPAPGDVARDGTADREDAARLAVTRDAPLDDVVALAIDAPEQVASIATARAAGVPVHLVPAAVPNPQATASVVEALHAAARPRTLVVGAAFGAEPALEWKVRSAATGVQLPGGGQVLFPRHQFVALYGTPATTRLGVLGEQDAAASVQRVRDLAGQYTGLTDRTVVPMFEMIATVAAGSPGADGNFSNEQGVDTLRPWVDAAAAAGVSVVLDLQPGRSDFLSQARQYEELLRLPHVGLALDPEWRLGPDEQPLQRIGSVSSAEVNDVVRWLADLTNAHALPPKMLVVHQFRLDMIGDRAALDTTRPEVAVVLHADGQGSQPAKQSTWRALHAGAPPGVAWGWKNFLDEDLPVLTPAETVRDVVPLPDLVTYQ